MKGLRGVVPVVNTTFHDDGRIDLKSQRRLVRFLIGCGAHGLALFGDAGEGYALAEDERRRLFKVIAEENAGALPLVVSCGHTGTDVAIALSREAEEGGASVLMALPPHFMKPDAEGIYHYFREISNAVSIPIMVEDAPLITQVSMSADLLTRMGREIDHVELVKVEAPPTADKISRLRAVAGDALVLFGGQNGQFLLEELGRGAVGTMPGSDMADAFVALWSAYEAGEVPTARERFQRMLPLIRYELQPGHGVAVMKQNLFDAGIIASPRVRHPATRLEATEILEVRALRADLDLLAFHRPDQ